MVLIHFYPKSCVNFHNVMRKLLNLVEKSKHIFRHSVQTLPIPTPVAPSTDGVASSATLPDVDEEGLAISGSMLARGR